MGPEPSIPHDPDDSDDLLLLELGRRVLRRDVRRVSEFADGLLAGTQHLDDRRRDAFAEIVERLCDEAVAEQMFEDSLLWPLLERHAPDALPYAEIRTVRRELRTLLDDARRTTRAVVAHLAHRPAALATPEDHRRVGQLARSWRRLRDHFDAFVETSGPDVAEVVTTSVPREDWASTLDTVRERLPDRRGAGARVVEVATGAELVRLRGQLGSRPLVGWRHHGRRRRAQEALVFGVETIALPAELEDDESDSRPRP
jgi:hypothetical protein